ncbi:MAG TPA: amidohydrolase family protein [Planctomycetota bacterium]
MAGCVSTPDERTFDVVLRGGRVLDPESGLDAVRHVGLSGGKIRAVSSDPLRGRLEIDARGLVVAPGFIDLHQHAQDPEAYALKALDGVTSALELEIGTDDVDRWYAEREGKALIHHGVSIGHPPVRMAALGDPVEFLPPSTSNANRKAASAAEIAEIRRRIEHGLRRGAPAVGFGLQYTSAASREEVLEAFRAAAAFGASCHVHLRHGGTKETDNCLTGLEEVLAASASAGAPLHVVHLHSTSVGWTPRALKAVADARARGVDVTAECYPYTAGMTRIQSAIFDGDWRTSRGIDYQDLLWPPTGERLTAESFERYRKLGGLVAVFSIPEEAVRAALADPEVIVGSDGIREGGSWHPRSAGTCARVLGRYVREEKVLTLMDAVRKMSLLPARRLERRAPVFRDKGRIRPGADADLTLFDPATVIDRATYEKPTEPSAGIRHVFVDGVAVVREGRLVADVLPGRPLRAPIRN